VVDCRGDDHLLAWIERAAIAVWVAEMRVADEVLVRRDAAEAAAAAEAGGM
jgi:hypothetical protein